MGRPKGSKNRAKGDPVAVGGNSQELLRSLVDRIEALEDNKQVIADDIKDVYDEAKSGGFDTAAIRHIIKLRKQDKDVRDARQHVIDTYMHALGMLADTPLGQAAVQREFGSHQPAA